MLTNTQRINCLVRERLNQSGRPDTPVGIFLSYKFLVKQNNVARCQLSIFSVNSKPIVTSHTAPVPLPGYRETPPTARCWLCPLRLLLSLSTSSHCVEASTNKASLFPRSPGNTGLSVLSFLMPSREAAVVNPI